MVRLLEDREVDLDAESLDNTIVEADDADVRESIARLNGSFMPVENLRDGRRGNRITKGRAVARRAWMWDGTESVIPLAWTPNGLVNDRGQHYLRKLHCVCCNLSGTWKRCPQCVNCTRCRGGSDKTALIKCFYLKKKDVPFPKDLYGAVDCFHPSCIRKGSVGFKSQETMRLHARSKHRMEYASFMEAQAAARDTETDSLRHQVDELRSLLLKDRFQPVAEAMVEEQPLPKVRRKRRARTI